MFHICCSKPVFLFFIFLLTVYGLRAQVINPQVNGIDIGTKYSAIVRKLGSPISYKRSGEVPCGEAMRTLRYSGLTLRLEVSGTNPLGLYKVEVTSPKWAVSGLRIGASRREVMSKFGRAPYFINDGFANFYFRRNRLVKMQWEFNFC